MNHMTRGTLIALAAGTLFATACKKEEPKPAAPPATTTETPTKDKAGVAPVKPNSAEKTASVHCMGINTCAGKGACMTADNGCAGKNSCTGKGFLDVASEQECKDKGGKVNASVGM